MPMPIDGFVAYPDGGDPIKVLDHGEVSYAAHMGDDSSIIRAARMSTQKGFLGWGPGHVCRYCHTTKERGEGKVAHHEFVEREAISAGMTGCRTCGYGIGAFQHNLACSDAPKGVHVFEPHGGDAKLLEYLYRNKHMTPFEMCELVLKVKAPIEVFRQLHRHRTFSINEESARYSQMKNEHYVPELSRFDAVASANRQASSVTGIVPMPAFSRETMQGCVQREQQDVYTEYVHMLEAGVPKEVARINTPVSRYSSMMWKANLRNWLQMLTLRDEEHAQWETREFAKACGLMVQRLFPRTYWLWEEHTKHSVTLSRSEAASLKAMLCDLRDGHQSLPAESEPLYLRLTK